jgi:hypothetical protein
MHDWKLSLRRGLVSGAVASVLSTLGLALCGKGETQRVLVHVNIISHWLWGEDADGRERATIKYTVAGYLIHHASATFWAVLHERWFGRTLDKKQAVPALRAAAATSAIACFTDYRLTPPRLRPGFERRLSRPSLALVYALFGAGLALGSMLCRPDRSR